MLRRILAENGKEYRWTYVVAVACLLIVSGTTAFTAWIMAPMINQIFYERRSDMIVWICAGFMGASLLRGFAGYGLPMAKLRRAGRSPSGRDQARQCRPAVLTPNSEGVLA